MKKPLLLLLGLVTAAMAMDDDFNSDQLTSVKECVASVKTDYKNFLEENIVDYFKNAREVLNLSLLRLDDEDFQNGVLPFLDKNKNIKNVDISNNALQLKFEKEDALSFFYVSIKNNYLSASTPPVWAINTKIVELNISFNALTDESFKEILKKPELRTLEANNCGITDNGVSGVEESQIVNLSIANNHLTEQGLRSLLKINTLEILALENNEIEFIPDDCCSIIKNKTLKLYLEEES